VRLNLDPWNTLAELIERAMAGVAPDEIALDAAIVRYYAYLGRIKPAFEAKYKTPLIVRIASETDGEYEDLLMHVIDAPRSVGDSPECGSESVSATVTSTSKIPPPPHDAVCDLERSPKSGAYGFCRSLLRFAGEKIAYTVFFRPSKQKMICVKTWVTFASSREQALHCLFRHFQRFGWVKIRSGFVHRR
jgi:hypothetical protein